VSKKQLPDTKITKAEEDWMTKKWRPMMAIMYMIACIFDFVMFPIMFTVVQFWEVSAANDAFRQWAPITLQGGGLFHVAMGAVLGVSAWSRGQEKMAGVSGGPVAGANNATQLSSPTPGASTFGVPAPATNSWGSQPLGGGSSFGGAPQSTAYNPPPSWGQTPVATAAPVNTGWGGKKAPPEPDYPVID
jgi:hypothetical protein